MTIQNLFGADFEPPVKSRGRELFRHRRVKRVWLDEGTVLALVDGEQDLYETSVAVDPDGQRNYGCTCPFYLDSDRGPCKHIWATILEAERLGLTAGFGEIVADDQQSDSSVATSNGEDASEEPGEFDDDQLIPMRRPAARRARLRQRQGDSINDYFKNGSATAGKKRQDWQRQFDRLAALMSVSPAVAPSRLWPANRHVVYMLDIEETMETEHLIVQLGAIGISRDGTRERMRSVKILPDQIPDMPDPLDRQILQMLVGSSRVDLQACKLEYSIVSPK